MCPLHTFSSKEHWWESSVCAVEVHSQSQLRVRVNEGDFMCQVFHVGWRPALHIMFSGFGAIASSCQGNLQACVH